MKNKICLILLFCSFQSILLLGQTNGTKCPNVNTNFTGWTKYYALNYYVGIETVDKLLDSDKLPWVTSQNPDENNVFTVITDKSAKDKGPYNIDGVFNIVRPGSNAVIKLGNDASQHHANRLVYEFEVNKENSYFNYYYAINFQAAPHCNNEQPFFEVKVLVEDVKNSGIYIPVTCGNLVYASPRSTEEQKKCKEETNSNLVGFIPYPSATGAWFYYKPWSSNGVDLSHYDTKKVKVIFSTGDCNQGGHYGYAYIDMSCLQNGIVSTFTDNCNEANFKMIRDVTFVNETYSWNFGTGEGTADTKDVKHTFANSGKKSVTLTINQAGTSLTGCNQTIINAEIDLPDCAPPCNPNSPLKYGSNWYFGQNAALKFADTGPVPVSGSVMVASEGSASMSDADGNLLFYTDGNKVFGSDNISMTGVIKGSTSATQSAVICKYPGSSSKYFIFTSGEASNGGHKYYSVIDMSLKNGKGDISVPGTIEFENGTSEKLEIIKNPSKDSYWLLTANDFEIRVFEITSTGFNTVPHVFKFRAPTPNNGYSQYASRNIGYMKASPSGRLLAMANYGIYCEILNFDPIGGMLTNQRKLNIGTEAYGVSFSANEEYVYFSSIGYNNIPKIYQVVVSRTMTETEIQKRSRIMYSDYSGRGITTEALQLGPDGNIYVARAQKINKPNTIEPHKISVIQNPSSLSATFGILSVELGTSNSISGLPNIPGYQVVSPSILGETAIACNGSIDLIAEGGESYLWTYPNNTTSTSATVKIGTAFESNIGEYKVEIIKSTGCSVTKTITINMNCTPSQSCVDCVPSFAPIPGNKYLISGWVKKSISTPTNTYTGVGLGVHFKTRSGETPESLFTPSGPIIDGWQRVEASFVVPKDATNIVLELVNDDQNVDAYFDDIRVHPFQSNMKSFVYDPSSQKLVAELDENNYATKYEYDDEGILIRVKKETERGVMTIKETRNNQSKLSK